MRLPTLPDRAPRWWPRFSSPLHSPAVTARVGRVLGICFAVCFVTGMLSHYQYQPWSWLPEPVTPVWGYRLTQGVHVITGIATIPLLLVKLWTVYPKLFEWPPARTVAHAVERLSIAVLVASSLVELITGFFNVLDWYPWPWGFVFVHRQLAYVVIGSLLVHIAVKLPIIRQGLSTPLREGPITRGLTRRGLLVAAAAGAGTVALTTVGQTFTPLAPVAILAPRQPKDGPLGVPINKTATEANVLKTAVAASYRLTVAGPRPFTLDLAQLEALPTMTRVLPIACVEGWSVSAHWRGPALLDLIRQAGGDSSARVRVSSLEQGGSYHTSHVDGPQLREALLATFLNGSRIPLDHGFPVRLIAPDRAGVLNTKWVTKVEIL